MGGGFKALDGHAIPPGGAIIGAHLFPGGPEGFMAGCLIKEAIWRKARRRHPALCQSSFRAFFHGHVKIISNDHKIS